MNFHVQPRDFLASFIFFRWWSDAQRRMHTWPFTRQLAVLLPFIILGVSARMWAQTGVRNYDFESYLIVSEIGLDGGNPYGTNRYNYGPVWFVGLVGMRFLAPDPDMFRLVLASFLALVDVAIALILLRKGYGLAACLFMLAPVAIAISGQHQQFDNAAVLLAMMGGILAARSRDTKLRKSDWLALALLSASLVTKHIFILLPLWIAYQQRGSLKRLAYLLIPPGVFLLSLLPFMYLNRQAVIDNVFLYDSFNNSPFLNYLLPDPLAAAVLEAGVGVVFFLLLVAVLGIVFRRVRGLELVMVYAVTTVVFSSAIADQYLAIPLIAVTGLLNLGFAAWLLLASIYLVGNPETIAAPMLEQLRPYFFSSSEQAYQDLFLPLFVGWVIMIVWLLRRSAESASPPRVEVDR